MVSFGLSGVQENTNIKNVSSFICVAYRRPLLWHTCLLAILINLSVPGGLGSPALWSIACGHLTITPMCGGIPQNIALYAEALPFFFSGTKRRKPVPA